MVLKEKILLVLKEFPGLTDRQITDRVLGLHKPQQSVNQICRDLESKGFLIRQTREDGRIGNYLQGNVPDISNDLSNKQTSSNELGLSEDEIKKVLKELLESQGWTVQVAWSRTPGIDVDAKRGSERWIIEVKGPGSLQPMRVNYFIGILGELLQRMEDPTAKYSIALPDIKQFRGLWERLPKLAKERTGINALFIDLDGKVVEEL
jgi:hypothetical protein